jgi:hypothetical protein
MTTDTAGIERFAEIKARVVETYGIDPKDEQANVVASLIIARERMVEAIAAGETRVDFVAFTRVLELLKEYAPPLVPKVTLSIVGRGETATCPKCQHEFRTPHKERTLDQARAEGSAKARVEEAEKAKRRLEAMAAAASDQAEAKDEPVKPAAPVKPYHATMTRDTRDARPGLVRVNVSDGQDWFGGASKRASSFNQAAPADPHPYRNRTPYDNGG